MVKNTKDARRLTDRIAGDRRAFNCKPASIIPLSIVTQGLLGPK